MLDISILTEGYKPTNITGGAPPCIQNNRSQHLGSQLRLWGPPWKTPLSKLCPGCPGCPVPPGSVQDASLIHGSRWNGHHWTRMLLARKSKIGRITRVYLGGVSNKKLIGNMLHFNGELTGFHRIFHWVFYVDLARMTLRVLGSSSWLRFYVNPWPIRSLGPSFCTLQ